MDPYLRIASLEADYEKLSSAYRQKNQEVQELRIGTQQLQARVKELEDEVHTVWANVADLKQQLATAGAVYTELRQALTAENERLNERLLHEDTKYDQLERERNELLRKREHLLSCVSSLRRDAANARAQAFMEAQDVRPIASDVPPDSQPNVWLDTWSARIEELRRRPPATAATK